MNNMGDSRLYYSRIEVGGEIAPGIGSGYNEAKGVRQWVKLM
jgi:hypothetical protein